GLRFRSLQCWGVGWTLRVLGFLLGQLRVWPGRMLRRRLSLPRPHSWRMLVWVARFQISIWAGRRRSLLRWPGWHPVRRCQSQWRTLRTRCLGPPALSLWLMARVPLVAPRVGLPGTSVAGLLLVARGPRQV